METEGIIIRGHHIDSVYHWFMVDRTDALALIVNRSKKYGEDFVQATLSLMRRLDEEPDLKIRITVCQEDSLCAACPGQIKENCRQNPFSVFLADIKFAKNYHVEPDRVYTRSELKEIFADVR